MEEQGGLKKKDVPTYWANSHVSETKDLHFDVLIYVDTDKHSVFDDLLKQTYCATATQDRKCPFDTKGHEHIPGGCPCVQPGGTPGLPTEYRVRRVMRVEDAGIWERYVRKRDQIREQRISGDSDIVPLDPPVETDRVIAQYPEIFQPLDHELNETYLWHGTFVRHALSIAQSDFQINRAGESRGTMYGAGAYFAESSTKADEYAKDEPDGYYQGVFVMLLCRSLLGKYYYTTKRDEEAGKHVETGEFDSTVGDRRSSANTFREFVLYDPDMTYPEYIVLYQRVHKDDDKDVLERDLKLPYHMELPVYWTNFHKDPRNDPFDEQYGVNVQTHSALQHLVGVSMQGCLKLQRVRRVENANVWVKYVDFKQSLRLKLHEEAVKKGEIDADPEDLEAGAPKSAKVPAVIPATDEHFDLGVFFCCCCCCFCFWIPLVFFLGSSNVDSGCEWSFFGAWMKIFSFIIVAIQPVFMFGLHYFFKITQSPKLWAKKEWIIIIPQIIMLTMCIYGLNKAGDISEGKCTKPGSSGVKPVPAHEAITIIILVFTALWCCVFTLAAFGGDDDETTKTMDKFRPKMALFGQNLRCVPADELDGNDGEGQVSTFKHLQDLKVDGKLDEAISIENLEESLNEHLLWHGTTKEAAEAIVHNDFYIPKGSQVAHGCRFGVGAYFAENLDKSLSYAKNEDGTKYILLCRVTCGQFFYTESSVDTNAHTKAQAENLNCVLANPGKGQEPREFIVLTADQVYPEFILEVSSSEQFDEKAACVAILPPVDA